MIPHFYVISPMILLEVMYVRHKSKLPFIVSICFRLLILRQTMPLKTSEPLLQHVDLGRFLLIHRGNFRIGQVKLPQSTVASTVIPR